MTKNEAIDLAIDDMHISYIDKLARTYGKRKVELLHDEYFNAIATLEGLKDKVKDE